MLLRAPNRVGDEPALNRPRPWRAVAVATVLLGTIALGACAAPAGLGPEPARTQVVPIDRVVQAFQDICVDTAPGFEAAPERFAAHGLTRQAGGGVVYHETGTLSVRVQQLTTTNGPKLRCSVVYEDPNRYIARERIDLMAREFSVLLGRPRTAQFATLHGARRQGRAWVFRAGGREGSMLDVPFAGGENLGVLILQFPSS
jgi:hypothetical protein